jgi:hypothetical protein
LFKSKKIIIMKNLVVLIIIVLTSSSCIENPKKVIEKPFFDVKGSFETISTIKSITPSVSPLGQIQEVEITGVGTMTHLGKATFEALSTLKLFPPPPFNLSATSTMVAANGDEIHTEAVGTSVPQADGLVLVTINHTIVGGTGKFKNAEGYLVGVSLTDRADPAGVLEMEGKIRY